MDKVKVKLVSFTPNYKDLLMLACSKPYGKDVTMKGVGRIIESGHLSVLEHCSASFELDESTRVLGQFTRHRHKSFTVKSARGSRFDQMVIPQRIEDRIRDVIRAVSPHLTDEQVEFAVQKEKERMSRRAMQMYNDFLNEGIPHEDAAYFLPQGALTSKIVTGNLRAWYEYLPKRLCKRAMPEHRKVAEMIYAELKKAMPEIFDRNFMNCENCKEHSCEFH